jgi:MFS family permease
MLIGGIALGLVLGLLLGGRLDRLADVRLRVLPLLFVAVIVRFGTEILIGQGVGLVDQLRLPLFALGYTLLLYALWRNRTYPGMALAFIGIGANALAIAVNGGWMPVWQPAYDASGLTGPLPSVLHVMLPAGTTPDFLLRLGPLGDVIPIPVPFVRNVASIGDIFLTAGLGFFLFATLLRQPDAAAAVDADEAVGSAGPIRIHRPRAGAAGSGVLPSTGLASAFQAGAALERPQMLGGGGTGMASPSLLPLGVAAGGAAAAAAGAGAGIGVGVLEPSAQPFGQGIRSHPYIRLALNGSFSALWVGQVISLFGDRVNQIALGAFVYEITKSPIAVALTFFSGTIPNLVFSPLAGAFVDRWDQKRVMVVSDILRAALVMVVPGAVLVNVWLAYPLVFVITTVSIFFRPARAAALPRIVPEEDLLAANSAMWVGETLADVVNYPLAGLFVVFLASSISLAFWFDAVTYLASAALLATIVVPKVVKRGAADGEADAGAEASTTVLADLKVGWAFLRRETVLLANTLQGTAGQFAVGIMTVASIPLAQQITASQGLEYRATYAFMETSIGLGNLIGGFVLGLVAAKVRKGPMVAAAYAVFGILIVGVGNASTVPVVLALLFGVGVANMAFVIPSQTLFQLRTPPELIGRVVSFRFALVFGGMSIAMAVGGLLITVFGPGAVIAGAGAISVVAGLSGLLVKAVREA